MGHRLAAVHQDDHRQRRHRGQRADSNVYVQSVEVNGHRRRSCPCFMGHDRLPDGPKPVVVGYRHERRAAVTDQGSAQAQPSQDTTGPGLGTATATGGQDAAKLFDDSSITQPTFAAGMLSTTWAFRGDKQAPTHSLHPLRGEARATRRIGGCRYQWTGHLHLDHRLSAAARRSPWRNQTRPFRISSPGSSRSSASPLTKTADAAQPREYSSCSPAVTSSRWRRTTGHRRGARDVRRRGIGAAGHYGHRHRLPGHDRLG